MILPDPECSGIRMLMHEVAWGRSNSSNAPPTQGDLGISDRNNLVPCRLCWGIRRSLLYQGHGSR
jgi:hypothetical protein